ncbi:MAG: NrfD/PsrC family molybdoenzyme membrane anchor subunit [Anaerolineae bacterium]
MAEARTDSAAWRQPSADQDPEIEHQLEHARRRHLLLDPRYPLELGKDVIDPMIHTGRMFWMLLAIFGGLFLMYLITWGYQMVNGLGITGLSRPVFWALYIVNFVYFVGVGHAGTFISAALRVLRIEWRRPIARAAELVTLFGLGAAAMFPLVHLGRAWKFYWLAPIPNERQLWPNFHSPLVWDFFAISTYLTGSALFVFLSLLPDLAMVRDHTTGWRKILYGLVALGWRGTEREWAHLETAQNIFSYVIIPVMFSVHTIVSYDFAMAIQPGWHSTIFGPYFIIGALFSGVGAVILAMILIRKGMHLEYFIREEHFDGMAKFLLILSFGWAYFYFNDYIVTWYGNMPVDRAIADMMEKGWASPFWYVMLVSNILIPWVILWNKRWRTNLWILAFVCVFVQVGMYLERWIIVPVTLGRNYLPFDWGIYYPHLPETIITIGAFAMVFFLYLLASRFIPLIPVWEVQEGQMLQGLRRIGRAVLPTRVEH